MLTEKKIIIANIFWGYIKSLVLDWYVYLYIYITHIYDFVA